MTITKRTPLVRLAATPERNDLIQVLSTAFLDDPVFAWVYPDRALRQAILPDAFDAFATAFHRHRRTYVTGPDSQAQGAALWAPPGAAPVHPDDEPALETRLAELSGEHIERLGTCFEVLGAAHPEAPAWYLQFLAVEPSAQGQGLGSVLLRAILDEADRAGEAAYLEATSDRNRALYERHGFRCIADLALPDGPTAYAMWREPVTAPDPR